MTGYELLLLNLIEAVGALVQGTLGFGINLVSAPLLALIDPSLVPVPTLIVGMLSAAYVSFAHRKDPADTRGLIRALTGQLPGAAVGAVAITTLPAHASKVLFAVLILGAVCLTASRWQPARTTRTLLSTGLVSGFLSASSSVGGAPIALAYQNAPGRVVRSTLARYNAFSATVSLSLLAVTGAVHWSSGWGAMVLLPGFVVGTVLARCTHGVIDRPWVRPAVLLVVAVSAVMVLSVAV